jgi:site-specific recombinase XerD
MICPKCKKAAPDEAAFCPWCGKRLTAQERKHRKRANGTGTICRLSGNRAKPWMARKNDVLIGTFETRSEALKALERLTDTQINELYNLTFSEVYERWVREHGREVSEKLLKNYELAYTQCEALHGKRMRSLRRSDYQAAVIALEEQGLSKSSCNKLRTMLRQVCEYAQMEGILHSNPADDLTTVARQKSTREIFTEEDIAKIKVSSLPAAQLALIMISSGCRPGELFTVPLANCGKDHMIWGSKTEAGKNRVIPIGSDGVEAYQTLTILSTVKGGTLLVDGYAGSRNTENFRRRDWAQLMREIGREGMTPYSCRHTFITRAIRGGIDLISLEAIVGHVDKETTKLYTHLRASDLVTAVRDSTAKNAVSNKSATRKNSQISKAV